MPEDLNFLQPLCVYADDLSGCSSLVQWNLYNSNSISAC